MAFLGRVGSILKQRVSKQIGSQISASNPSIYQAVRCMSAPKIFVGGLPYCVDDKGLRDTFSKYGEILEARVVADKETDNSRGFGFVAFSSTDEATSAIQAMDGQDLLGRTLRVNYAAAKAPRPYRGGGYAGGGFGRVSQGVASGVGNSLFGGGAAGFSNGQFEDGSSGRVSNDA